ncbi:50S ribosomal protein L15, partial [Candidatus Woesearchaeota archaeon]|nr:50S ribosomal protein L15 [Candidatus Woesearchaeota archaeon]
KTTHGYGSKKKHRGAGHRGGVGMAGTGKRADQKKPTILKLYGNAYYGKHGFHRPSKMLRPVHAVNLDYLNFRLSYYLAEKIATQEQGVIVLDVSKLGYDKVLGKGTLTQKITIKAKSFSASALKKIESAGGKAVTV